ncbi:Tripartite tricarboxylate transporter family receptor [Pigmentiphaga humi]|uniref:Tripartite tricarboxylate transporter family receptor n=1 Tax=Pigmentiphaga humi TaxID=2478468 RepID=A0A3P4B3H1_9BURK|nr:tripartite tricarboxylate transporter substrate binding protein [Pigmentiphaga humi]VCU70833.1 Tripartite tricarboxylate transporter family receptor [Pigmentiphaga humi]
MKSLFAALGLSMGMFATAAHAFPTQPLTVIVPYAAGGSSDALARALGQAVGKAANTAVVIEDRPGGGTVIGAQALLGKPADGHTVFMMAASFIINPYLIKNLPIDVNKDFQPITRLASNPHVLVVSPKVPVSDLQGFLTWTKAQHGKASFSSFGNGSSGHLGFELFKQRAGLEMLHVPYKGSAPATMAVLSGEVDATLGDIGVIAPHVAAGKLKALAISADKRSPVLPDVPTFAEAGLAGFESETWMGLLTRSGVPQDRVARLNALFVQALADPEVRKTLQQQGMDPQPSSPEAFRSFLQQQSDQYRAAIEKAGLKPE